MCGSVLGVVVHTVVSLPANLASPRMTHPRTHDGYDLPPVQVRGSQDRKTSGSPQHPASSSAFEMFDRLLEDEESSDDDDVIIQRASGASPGHGSYARIRHDSDRASSQ